MADEQVLDCAAVVAAELAPLLHGAVADGLASAERRCSGFPHGTYPFIRPLMARVAIRQALVEQGLPSGWILGGNPTRMGQLQIENGTTSVRLLKERRRHYPGGTPPAGRNQERRLYWQPTLAFGDDGGSLLPDTRFLLLWDYVDSADGSLAFTLRLVHTLEPGAYGREVPLDLTLDLSGVIPEDLLSKVEFDTEAEGHLDFYALIEEEAQDGEVGGSAGG